MDYKVILGVIGAIVLFFFGTIFALASVYAPIRLAVATILFIAGFGSIIGVYMISKKSQQIVQRVELSGEMKAVSITCPNCSASIQPDKIRIINGVPYVTCSYCGKIVEVAEEPKW